MSALVASAVALARRRDELERAHDRLTVALVGAVVLAFAVGVFGYVAVAERDDAIRKMTHERDQCVSAIGAAIPLLNECARRLPVEEQSL